jgi:hypothetical protein
MVRLFVFALLLAVSRLFSQPTPEWKAFWEKQAASRKSGADALQRERERQKADPCSTAKSTKDISECLSWEFKTTDANYLAYVRSIGALLRLAPPADGPQSSAHTTVRSLGSHWATLSLRGNLTERKPAPRWLTSIGADQ